jgi:hypothetical protein
VTAERKPVALPETCTLCPHFTCGCFASGLRLPAGECNAVKAGYWAPTMTDGQPPAWCPLREASKEKADGK